jgi:hypothetical protein
MFAPRYLVNLADTGFPLSLGSCRLDGCPLVRDGSGIDCLQYEAGMLRSIPIVVGWRLHPLLKSWWLLQPLHIAVYWYMKSGVVLSKYIAMTCMTRAGSKMLGVLTRTLLGMMGPADVLGPKGFGECCAIWEGGVAGEGRGTPLVTLAPDLSPEQNLPFGARARFR